MILFISWFVFVPEIWPLDSSGHCYILLKLNKPVVAVTLGDWNIFLEQLPFFSLILIYNALLLVWSRPRFLRTAGEGHSFFLIWYIHHVWSHAAHSAVLLIYYLTHSEDFQVTLFLIPHGNVSSIRAETWSCFLVSWAPMRTWHTEDI